MNIEEKHRRAKLMSALLKQLTEIAVNKCSESGNQSPLLSMGDIQDAIKPHLDDAFTKDRVAFFELASMGITMVISDFIKHEIERIGKSGDDISITE